MFLSGLTVAGMENQQLQYSYRYRSKLIFDFFESEAS